MLMHIHTLFCRTTATFQPPKNPLRKWARVVQQRKLFLVGAKIFFFFFAIAKRCWDLWGKKEWLSDESRWLLPWELAFLFCFFIAANCKKQSPRNPSCDIIMIAYSSSKSLNPLPRKGQTEVIHRNVSVPLLLHPLWGKGSTFLACGFHRCSLTAEEWAYVYV